MKKVSKENIAIQDIEHMKQSAGWQIIEKQLQEDLERLKEMIINYKWWDDEKRHSPCELLRAKKEILEDIVNSPENIKNALDPVI